MPPASISGLEQRYKPEPHWMAGGREGKKMKSEGYLDTRVEDYVAQDDDLVLEADEFYMYDYPREEVIPEADYLALIVGAKVVNNGYRVTHYDVYSKLIHYRDFRSWMEGYCDYVPYYYMKQRYKIDSQPEREFRSIMAEKIGSKKFKLSQLVGLTDAIHLVYDTRSDFGRVSKHYPYAVSDESFEIPAAEP